jgi:hypothetical protein
MCRLPAVRASSVDLRIHFVAHFRNFWFVQGSGAAASQHSDAGAMQIDEDAAEVAPSQAFDKPVVSADHDDDVEDDCVMFSSLALPAAELYISLLQMPASFILFNPTCWSATLYLLSMFAKTHMSTLH